MSLIPAAHALRASPDTRRSATARLSARRGTVLIAIIVVLVLLQVLIAAALMGGARDADLSGKRLDATRAFYAAEAGMNMSIREIRAEADSDGDGTIGSVSNNSNSGDDPSLSGAQVYVTASTSGLVTTLTARARYGSSLRRVVATSQPSVSAQTFTGAGIGSTYNTFASLQSGHTAFMGVTTNRIGFDSLNVGTQLSTQYTGSDGVTFTNANTAIFGVRQEADANLEPCDGYDGTYRPNADKAYVRASNFYSSTPFTVTFTNPVGRLGCFVGMGKEGADGTLAVKVYDSSNALLADLTVTTAIWADPYNREGFFGIKSTSANIKTITFLNNSTVNYANALIFDELVWSLSPLPAAPPDVRSWTEATATGP